MFHFKRSAPQIPVVLASLLLWVSFAWGLPAEGSATEGEADVAAEDPWAGARISDAYDYAECRRCGHKNEIRRPACYRCGYELPQPSAEMTDPDMVFVPGKGYYREGAVVEPGKTRKGYWITGLVITGIGLPIMIGGLAIFTGGGDPVGIPLSIAGIGATAVGSLLIIKGFRIRTEPVSAFGSGERYGLYDGRAYTLRSPDSDSARLKVEVTLLGF